MNMNLAEFYTLNKDKSYTHPDITGVENILFNDLRIPYVSLDIPGPWKEMLSEAQALDHLFVDHRDTEGSNGWSSLCVHGLGAQKTDSPDNYPEYNDIRFEDLPWDWTEIADQCPVTVDYFKNIFPYESYYRLRFMRLAPGGYIVPHHDGSSHKLTVCNISLNNPVGCEMILENIGIVPFKDSGGAVAFNNSYNHIVWNQSNIARYHIIVHGKWNYHYEQLVNRSYTIHQ
jgi:hypothetical protein